MAIKTLIITLLVISIGFIASASGVNAQVDPFLRERLSAGPIIVDHNSISLFDQIPDAYLERARNIRFYFSDRSVGQNISESLDCLTATSWGASTNACRQAMIDDVNWCPKTFTNSDLTLGRVPAELMFTPDPVKYNRSKIIYEFKQGTWNELTADFLNNLFPTRIPTNDVVTYQFSYLNVTNTDTSINDARCGFLATGDRSGCSTSFRDNHVGRISELESQYMNQNKAFVYWTTSLARGIGTNISTVFNNSMRSYAQSNNKILFDIADIVSYDPIGRQCFDDRDGVSYTRKQIDSATCAPMAFSENYPNDFQSYPAICQNYTVEVDNGHFTLGGARVRTAKAFWVLLAQIAGWNPGGVVSPTATPTTVPTNTPVILQADANRDGRVDGIDYVIWISNYNRVTNGREAEGDFNSDGRVDGLDYVLWLTNYGISALTDGVSLKYSKV